MNYYNDFMQLYLVKLCNRYRNGSEEERKQIEQEIFSNKHLKLFQKRYIFAVIIGKDKFPYIEKDNLFKKYK